MLPGQLESCTIMIKLWCRFKWFLNMTIQTCGRKRPDMVIFMTGKTLCVQTQICTFLWFKFLICNVFWSMTCLAILFCMWNAQIISCKLVIEFCCIEPDQLKVLSIMLTMTSKALFTSHINWWMITFFKTYSGLDLSMAHKTFCIGNFVTQHMALCAVG